MRRLFVKLIAAGLMLGASTVASAADKPGLSATLLRGGTFSLEDSRGKVVLINFWATWCVPCRAEMPALDAYYRVHRGAGLEMLAVSLDADGSKSKILKATSAFQFPAARLADTRISRSDVPTALPATRIYGRDGKVRYESMGQPLDAASLERLVAPLLAERR